MEGAMVMTITEMRELKEQKGYTLEEIAEKSGIDIELAAKIFYKKEQIGQKEFYDLLTYSEIRELEKVFVEADKNKAAEAMGATTWQTIRYFLLPETLGSIVLALTTGTIGLLGASAMAGYVGGGGVGDLALTYGYQRMNTPLMIFTVVVLVIFVQILQFAGNTISRKLRQHR